MIKNLGILFFCAILNIGTSWNFDPPWDTLKVTWGIPFIKRNAFSPLPLTAREALNAGYTKISHPCSGTFNGHRYLKANDTAVILMYDVNGNIAGIQTAVRKSLVESVSKLYLYDKSAVYQEDKIYGWNLYTLTAYFTDPDTICTTGRSAYDVGKEGVGDNLFLRNGATWIKVNKKQDDSCIADKRWKKGGCFISMGCHYWYNLQKNLPPEEFFPFSILYSSRGKLIGFVFVFFGEFTFSDRYEYPPKEALNIFLNPIPKSFPILYDEVAFTTLHVYFNTNPVHLLC